MIKDLNIINGFIQGDIFSMNSIFKYSLKGNFNADDLKRLAGSIKNEPFNYVIDKYNKIELSQGDAIEFKNELYKIADYLEDNIQ